MVGVSRPIGHPDDHGAVSGGAVGYVGSHGAVVGGVGGGGFGGGGGADNTADAIEEGIAAGLRRASVYFPNVPVEVINEEFRDDMWRLFNSWPDMSPRSISFYVETATVASISRAIYNDSRLTRDDHESFLERFKYFLNSWTHR
jgi:hypothetical protein